MESKIIETSSEIFNVLSQYDFRQTDNQCSWCTFKVISNGIYFCSENFDMIAKMYNIWLENASEDKKQHSKIICGENIDDPELQAFYTNITILGTEYVESGTENKENLLSILPEPLKSTFFMPKKPVIDISIFSELVRKFLPYPKRFMAINRFGQSFALIGSFQGKIAICDSHQHKIMITTPQNVLDYIFPEGGGYNLVTFVYGYITN